MSRKNARKRPNSLELSNPKTATTVLQHFQGPIPSPSALADYKAIDPKLPLMIMEMARTEQEHRHHIDRQKMDVSEKSLAVDRTKIEGQIEARRYDCTFGVRGQWLTFVTAVMFLSVLVWFGYMGLERAICWGFGTGGFIVISRFFAPNRRGRVEEKTPPSLPSG